MKILTSCILLLISIASLSAQETKKKIREGKRVLPEVKLPKLDTLKYQKKQLDKDSLIGGENFTNSIPIAKTDKFYFNMPVKKLTGKNSVRMPGTEKLDSVEVINRVRNKRELFHNK